jgi:hypothetical protein
LGVGGDHGKQSSPTAGHRKSDAATVAKKQKPSGVLLELLRQMRGDITQFRTEMHDSLHRVEVRLGVLE